jgi:hypothetical protein
MRALWILPLAALATAPGAGAQDGPVIAVSPPPPLLSAGPLQGEAVDPADQALAAKGAKPFAPLVSEVVMQFDDTLADYPTARFKDVSFGYRDGKKVICGLYNAKNRMGGYTGWAVFYAFTGEAPRVVILNADDRPAFSYNYHCSSLTAWIPGDWSSLMVFKP